MTLFGPDGSAAQRGIRLTEADWARADFVFWRASIGTEIDTTFTPMKIEALRRMKPFAAYHFVLPLDGSVRSSGSALTQAEACARSIDDTRITVMLDWEHSASRDVDVEWAAALAVGQALSTVFGYRVTLGYLPQWYWASHGRPDLRDLAVELVSSAYNNALSGDHEDIYAAMGVGSARGWDEYSGMQPRFYQFTSKGQWGDKLMDWNAYDGVVSLARYFYTGAPMAAIDTVPKTKVVVPSIVRTMPNGQLPDSVMRDPGDNRGKLNLLMSYTWQAVLIAAEADGVHLATTGRYRTLTRQIALFFERFTTVNTGRVSKVYLGIRYWLRKGAAQAGTPGTSNHGYGQADDVCELDALGRIIGLTDRGLLWLRDNAARFGIGLESRDERWHWHGLFGDRLTQGTMAVLAFCGIGWPDWMGTLEGVEPAPPGDEPIPGPDPDPGPGLPPVDLDQGVYGLVGYAISQMDPRPVLSIGNRFDDDPLHVRFLQAVLKFEASRFALWFANSGDVAGDDARKLYLIACYQECSGLNIDGDYGPKTAHAVEVFQYGFGGAVLDGFDVGPMIQTVAEIGVVTSWTWDVVLQLATKQWYGHS